MDPYTAVMAPFEFNGLKLRNRVVMSPMGTQFAAEDGSVTERLIRHYTERAEGGVGLIITEHTGVSDDNRATEHMLMLSRPEHMPGMKRLADAVHQAGARFAIQLNYPGKGCTVPELGEDRLKAITAAFAAAAVRARDCGADGVELHMANGYLLHRFLSPRTNTRTDAYGGSLAARARFPAEVMAAVREAVGPGFPVWCRLCVTEGMPGGIEVEDAKYNAAVMEQAGADAIHVTAGSQDSLFFVHPTYYSEDCPNMSRAKKLAAGLRIPVIAGGKVRTLREADTAIKMGCCDLVSIGRPLIADPELVRKTVEGCVAQITPCLSCCACVKAYRSGGLRCTVNPEVGTGLVYQQEQPFTPLRVLVIGGGIAGLECAVTCAQAGHYVILAEKSQRLGGHVNEAMVPPGKSPLSDLLELLIRRAQESGVDIRLGTTITAENIARWEPDVAVIAVGAVPKVPPIPGLAQAKNVKTFEDVLGPRPADVGDKVLILGGGVVGAEMADYLSAQGKSVTIVEMRGEIAFDAVVHLKHDIMAQFQKYGVQVMTDTKVVGFQPDGVLVERDGQQVLLSGYSSVILAMGLSSAQPDLEELLRDQVKYVVSIGDSVRPRQIVDAMEEGYSVLADLKE